MGLFVGSVGRIKLPASSGGGGGGSSNASDLTSGTLSDARLSANVLLSDSAQSVTKVKTFTDNWSNFQAIFGQSGQSGRISFNNGSNGLGGFTVGYASATSAAPYIISTVNTGLNISASHATGGFMYFNTGGSESLRILPNGNLLLGTTTDGGQKFQVNGTGVFSSGIITGGNITPSTNITANLGGTSNRYATIYGVNVFAENFLNTNSGTTVYGTNLANGTIQFRQGTTSQLIGGFYGTSGNYTLQAPAATLGTDTGERFQVEGTSRLGGDVSVGGNINFPTNITYSIGTTNTRPLNVYSSNFISPSGFFGSSSTGIGINLALGNASQTAVRIQNSTGNVYLQAPGNVQTDNGYRLTVAGTMLAMGNIEPNGNATIDLGNATNRWLNLYTARISSGAVGQTLSFNSDGTTNSTYLVAYPTTRNIAIQGPGAITTDTGERLQVEGSARFGGAVRFSSNITQASTGNYYNYNTTDESTNYERAYQTWNANAYTIGLEKAGTGQDRDLRLTSGLGSRTFTIKGASGTTTGIFNFTALSGAVNVPIVAIGGSNLTTATGIQYSLAIFNTVNQSNASGYTAYYASIYEASVGTAAKYLIDLGTNSASNNTGTHTSRFSVDNVGNTIVGGNLTVSGALAFANLSLSGTLGVTGMTTLGGTLHLRVGAAATGSQPLDFQSGPLLTAPVAGAVEFLTDDWYGTITTGTARKKFVMADATAGLTSGRIPYNTTAGRLLDVSTFLFANTAGGRLSIGTTSATANLNIGATATATGNLPLAVFTGAAHTNQTLSVELNDIFFNLNRTVQFATGAQALLRSVRIAAPTYAFVGASTIAKASTVSISGAPIAGTNATITNAFALEVESGNVQFAGNLRVNTIPALGTAATNVIVSNGGLLSTRTLSEFITDISASASPRITSVASASTITPNVDTTDQLNVTALATAATFAAPTGTYTDGFALMIRITSDATARALTWNAIYRASEITLPTTTVASRTMYIQFVYNALASKFDLTGTTGGII